jgi:hypothetical protein
MSVTVSVGFGKRIFEIEHKSAMVYTGRYCVLRFNAIPPSIVNKAMRALQENSNLRSCIDYSKAEMFVEIWPMGDINLSTLFENHVFPALQKTLWTRGAVQGAVNMSYFPLEDQGRIMREISMRHPSLYDYTPTPPDEATQPLDDLFGVFFEGEAKEEEKVREGTVSAAPRFVDDEIPSTPSSDDDEVPGTPQINDDEVPGTPQDDDVSGTPQDAASNVSHHVTAPGLSGFFTRSVSDPTHGYHSGHFSGPKFN